LRGRGAESLHAFEAGLNDGHGRSNEDSRFESWLQAWFEAEPAEPVLFDPSDQTPEIAPYGETFALFVARSWMQGGALLRRYPAEAIGQAVYGQLAYLHWNLSSERGGRLVWDAALTLYTEVFEPCADDRLAHLSEPGGAMASALFMFWDLARWRIDRSEDFQRRAFLGILERALASPKAAVQESALHGIGEYTPWDGEGEGALPEASALARTFIRHGTTTRPELFAYAGRAATGKVP